MAQAWVHTKNKGIQSLGDLHEAEEALGREHSLLWVDFEDPTEEDLEWVRKTFDIHPIAIDDYNSPNERPRVDRYGHFYSIVVAALNFKPSDQSLAERRLTLYIGETFLVTLHTEAMPELVEALNQWGTNIPEEPEIGMALYYILDTLIDDYFPLVDRLSEEVEDVEDEILQNARPAKLEKVFHLKRQLLFMRRAVAPERDVINELLRRDLPYFSDHVIIYLQDLYDHVVRVMDSVDTHRDLLAGALDLYVSVTSNRLAISANKLNETMQVLAAWSIILMSITLVAGVYGMNFEFMPELKWRLGYAWSFSLMAVIGGVLFYYFKRRKWL